MGHGVKHSCVKLLGFKSHEKKNPNLREPHKYPYLAVLFRLWNRSAKLLGNSCKQSKQIRFLFEFLYFVIKSTDYKNRKHY